MQALGLIFSVALHGALLAWAALELLSTGKLPEPAAPTIEAEIITIAEFTKLKQGDPEAKKLVAKATPDEPPQVSKKLAPKPKPPKPTPPPEASTPPPAPDKPEEPITKAPKPPTPDAISEKIDNSAPPVPAPPKADAAARKKKAEIQRKYKEKLKKEAAARRKKEAERKKKLAEKKKKAKKKKQEDFTKRMAALLDKTPEERGSRRSGTSLETDYTGPTAGEREGQGDQLTAREEDLLKGRISAQIRGCWRLPGGGGGIETTVVKVNWRLNKDGTIVGQPRVVGRSNDRLSQVAGDAAIRAVLCAAPFNLPNDMYSAWQEITWEFDPRAML